MSTPVSDDEISRWPQTFTYNGGGNVETITAIKNNKTGSGTTTYVKTFTWAGDDLTSVSEWVEQ